MGNVVVFGKAFKECGIGGRFSKFQIVQHSQWFELVNVDTLEDSRFCFQIHDRIDPRKFEQVGAADALSLHLDDAQWLSHFKTAQKVIAKIISKGNNRSENRYYIDQLNKSVIIANRMFVIEVTPVLREAHGVTTHAIFNYLFQRGVDVGGEDLVIAHLRFGTVYIHVNDQAYNTMLSEHDIDELYGVEDGLRNTGSKLKSGSRLPALEY